ncbi:PREDICTED: uncharacterized protein LOC109584181 [Amphimedon queenslandica]|uniref:Uncharacterized protein n=1 Tax=Amphimedon queenslandica TaxID=400682 RepID=A0A1X7U9V6_AMPQE|nr:PREDICTED: uncharacterized protein LOC109584181 [Amphimedon queenslandica]|eukprot:XP_019855368.1 PREDICTED: uncharacterized protein LOC109584181 [Amphimedon queenslandica]
MYGRVFLSALLLEVTTAGLTLNSGDNHINTISYMGIGAIVILSFTIIVGLMAIFMALKYSGFKCSRVSCCCSRSELQNHMQMRNSHSVNETLILENMDYSAERIYDECKVSANAIYNEVDGIIDKNPQPYMCPVIMFKPKDQPEAESIDEPKESTQGSIQNDEDQDKDGDSEDAYI